MYRNIVVLLCLYTVGSIFAADPLAYGPPAKRRCTGDGIFVSEVPMVSAQVELPKQEKEIVARRLKAHSMTFKDCSSSFPTQSNRDIYNAVMANDLLNEEEAPEADKQYECTQLTNSMADYLLQQNKFAKKELIYSLQDFEDYFAQPEDAKKRHISLRRGLTSIQQIFLEAEGDDQESIVESCDSYIKSLQDIDKEKAIIALLKAANYLNICCILDVSAMHAVSHYRNLFYRCPPCVERSIDEHSIDPELQQLISAHILQEYTCALSQRQQLQEFNGHTYEIASVAFNHDGSQFVSGSDDDMVRIWNARTGQLLHECNGHTGCVQSVVFNHTGAQIVSGAEDGTVRIWDANTGKQLWQFDYPDDEPLDYSDDDYSDDEAGFVFSVAFNHNGSQVVAGFCDKVCIWNVETGQLIREWDHWYVESVAFNHDGSQVIVGAGHDTVYIWSVQTGQLIREWKAHIYGISSVAFSHDGLQVVSGCETVRIWEAQTGQLLHECDGHTSLVFSVAFNHNDSQVVSGSRDGTVRIWDVKTGQQLQKCHTHTHEIRSVAFNHDGSQVVSASNKVMSAFQAHGMVCIWNFTGYDENVRALDLLQALYVHSQLSGDQLPEHAYLKELHASLPDNIKQILERRRIGLSSR